MRSGRDVLVEKPMAATLDEASEMLRVHQETGRQLGVMRNWLFGPVIWKSLQMVSRGEIGEVLSLQINMLDTPYDEMIVDPQHWCHSIPGGRLGECLIHPLYIAQAFLGDISVKDIQPAKRGPHSWVAFDEVQVSLKGQRGLGHAYVTFNAPRKSVVLEVVGTKGILRVDMINHTLVKLRACSRILAKQHSSLSERRLRRSSLRSVSGSRVATPSALKSLRSRLRRGDLSPCLLRKRIAPIRS